MDWTGATNTPTLAWFQSLNIYGSLTAISAMNWSATSNVYFKASSGSHTIDLDGLTTLSTIFFDGTGTFNLSDSMHLNGSIYFNNGTFNSNNHKIFATSLQTSYSAGTAAINLGSSDVYLSSYSAIYLSGSSPIFNAASAHLYFTYTSSGRVNFRCLSNSNFGTITSNSNVELTLTNSSATIDSLIVTYPSSSTSSSYFYLAGTINYLYLENSGLYLVSYTAYIKKAEINGLFYSDVNCSFDTLLLLKEGVAITHTFGSGRTCTINDSFLLKSNGYSKANVKSSSSSAATISMPSGTSFNTDFIELSNITATGGGTFNAGAKSNDGGVNTGWTFTGSTYTFLLTYNQICVSPSGYSEAKVVPDGNTTNFWWRQTVAPFDTLNTGIDTVMVNAAVNYIFVTKYGTNCLTEDSVFISIQVPANGSSQSYNNTAGSSDWEDCSNWNLGFIPDSLSDVSIASGKTALVQADTAWCKEIVNAGNLIITGGVLVIYGDFENNGTINQTRGEILFIGSTNASIMGTTRIVVDSVELNKVGTLTLGNVLCITNHFEFTDGILYSNSADTLCFETAAQSNGGKTNSFIDGPVYKVGYVAFIFPTRDDGVWSRIGISIPTTATSSTFKAQYFVALHGDTASHTSPVLKVSSKEYWQLDRAVGSGIVKVTLYFEDASRSGIADATKITMSRYDGSNWVDAGVSSYSASGSGMFTSNNVPNFSPFTFSSTGTTNPLPVELIEFMAKPFLNHQAQLNWTTASELNNSHFVIERSVNGKDFEAIDRVGGAGTSKEVINYSYADNTIPANQNVLYYRLNQFDYDGANEISEVRKIDFDSEVNPNLVKVYPNPFKNTIHIETKDQNTENMDVRITDVNGKQVFIEQYKVQGNQSEEINLNNLEGVMYIIRVSTYTKMYNFRVIKN